MKKNVSIIFGVFILFFVTVFSMGCGGKKTEVQVLKLSHPHPSGYPSDLAYKKFAEIVAKNSDGKFKIEIYPSAQLGSPKASLELAKSGVIQFVHINGAVIEGFAQIYSVLNLPYIFKDYAHYRKVMDSAKMREIFESTMDKGFVSLAYQENGARSIYTKSRPINQLSDLKGLKIRVQDSPSFIKMMKLLGAAPVALEFSDVYTSLQQGVIDGAENNFPSFVEVGHAEVAKYFSETNHVRVSDFLAVSGKFWSSLDEKDKKMFRDAAVEMEKFFVGLWADSEKKDRDKAINDYKVNITTPDLTEFRKAVLPMKEELAAKDPKMKELIDFIKTQEE